MILKRILCFLICTVLLVSLFSVTACATEDTMQQASVSQGSHTLDASKSLLGDGRLVSNTQAALLYEVNTQTLLYGYNADERMHPSSFVKLMTLLIAIEEGNLEEIITIKQEVLDTVPGDAMVVGLKAGETMNLQDLLYCMMVGSGNDAAAIIADAVCGSQSAFVDRMNAYAQQLGCNNTNFTNVHGLHHNDQYTTARDAAKIIEQGLRHDLFRLIIGTSVYTVSANDVSAERRLVTNNYLISTNVMEIYYDYRVTGGRTGKANDGTRCIAAVAEAGNMELISIVMGCRSVYENDGYTERVYGGFPETTKLLDNGFNGFRGVQLFHQDQVMRQYSVMGGNANLFLGASTDAYTVLPSGVSLEDLTFVYQDTFSGAYPSVPIEKGQALSSVQVWYGDVCIGSAELHAMNGVTEDVDMFVPSTHPQAKMPWWAWLLIIAGVLAAAFVLFVLALRYIPSFRRVVFGGHRRYRRR